MTRIQVAVTKGQICRLNALVLVGVLLALASVAYAERTNLPEERNFGMALPGGKCRVPPLPKWNEPEKWAWIQICEGKEADFNKHPNEGLDPRNPTHDDKWSKYRKLTSDFLETILLHEPFRSAIPRRGVRIFGAYFPNCIDLRDASIERPLRLAQSRFKSQVDMSRLRTPTVISLEDSKFDKGLNMDSASVGGDLFMRRSEFDEVDLRGAKIGDQLGMVGSTFTGKLNMDSISIGGSLFMSDEESDEGVLRETEFGEVILRGANIGHQLSMVGATFKGKLAMGSISVGRSLLMMKAKFGEVDLRGAKIDDQLAMEEATFAGKLIVNAASVGGDLFMRRAEFGEVVLVGAKIGDRLDMEGSTFAGKLNMGSVSTGGSLFMRDGESDEGVLRETEFDEVVLRGAKIGDQLSMVGATFTGKLDMGSVSVGSDLFMRRADFDEVVLRGAKIGDQLGMRGATFTGKLDMGSVSTGSSLFMRDAEFNEVVLRGAKIGDQLDMDGAAFTGKLDMETVSVGLDLFMRSVNFGRPANLIFLSIGSSLDARGATLRGLDLTDSKIKGELRLGSVNWMDIEGESYKDKNKNSHAPKLTLRNTSVGVLQDTTGTWPDHLEREFEGFTYDRLGGFGERGSSWFIKWLEKDESYSPQPYRYLVHTLRTFGYEDMADDILCASLERECRQLNRSQLKWWKLLVRRVFIGCGWQFFLAFLGLALVLTIIGTAFLRIAKESNRRSMKLGFWYSLDMLLPIIRLRERHYTDVDLNTWAKYYFYIHKILGYVLIFFVLAWLSGRLEEWGRAIFDSM